MTRGCVDRSGERVIPLRKRENVLCLRFRDFLSKAVDCLEGFKGGMKQWPKLMTRMFLRW